MCQRVDAVYFASYESLSNRVVLIFEQFNFKKAFADVFNGFRVGRA